MYRIFPVRSATPSRLQPTRWRWVLYLTLMLCGLGTGSHAAETIKVGDRVVSYWPAAGGEFLAAFQFDTADYRNTYTLDCRNRQFLWTSNVRISTGRRAGNNAGAEWRALTPESTTANAVYQAICPGLLGKSSPAHAMASPGRVIETAQRAPERAAQNPVAADAKQRAREIKAQEARQQIEPEFLLLAGRAERLIDQGEGTPAELATALQIDERRALQALERGLRLDVEPVTDVRTMQHDGRLHYGVTYQATSLIAEAEARQRLQRMEQEFSWNDWLAQVSSVGQERALALTCLFGSASEIPDRPQRLDTRLISFDSVERRVTIVLKCEPSASVLDDRTQADPRGAKQDAARRAEWEAQLAKLQPPEILADAELARYARDAGQPLFQEHCSGCHGNAGEGRPGFPVLADTDWLYGGSVAKIAESIANGRKGAMTAHQGLLSTDEIDTLASWVVEMAQTAGAGGSEAGWALFRSKGCTACHGEAANGVLAELPDGTTITVGAANLTDRIWRFEPGRYDSARHTILYGVNQPGVPESRHSSCPPFEGSIDSIDGPPRGAKIKKLAVYVHSLSSGDRATSPPSSGKGSSGAIAPMTAPAGSTSIDDGGGERRQAQGSSVSTDSGAHRSGSGTDAGTVYTPPKGDPERKAIMDAIRVGYNRPAQFLVHHLKVGGPWAWASVTGTIDGAAAYEPQSALLRKIGGKWTVVAELDHSGACAADPVCSKREYEELWAAYPEAPRGIFQREETESDSDARPTPSASQPAESLSRTERAGQWGPGIVPDRPVELAGNPCAGQETRACLERLGLSDEAIAFMIAVGGGSPGEIVATEFIELGQVDLARTSVPYAPWEALFLLNGAPSIITPRGNLSNLHQDFPDGASRRFLARFPGAAGLAYGLPGHRVLPHGGQRFVIATQLQDSCRACPTVGSAIAFVDFDADGRQLPRRNVGLVDTSSDLLGDSGTWTPSLFADHPAYLQYRLNLLGYDAGPMDGALGQRTAQALAEFQREHCLPATGALDQATLTSLSEAAGYKAPCGIEPLQAVSRAAAASPQMTAADRADVRARKSDSVEGDSPEGTYKLDATLMLAQIDQTVPAARLLEEVVLSEMLNVELTLKEDGSFVLVDIGANTVEKGRWKRDGTTVHYTFTERNGKRKDPLMIRGTYQDGVIRIPVNKNDLSRELVFRRQ